LTAQAGFVQSQLAKVSPQILCGHAIADALWQPWFVAHVLTRGALVDPLAQWSTFWLLLAQNGGANDNAAQ